MNPYPFSPNFSAPGASLHPSINPTWNSLPRVPVPLATVNNSNLSFPLHKNTADAPGGLNISDSFQYNPQNSIDLDDYIGVLKQFISVAETTVKQVADFVKLDLRTVDAELSCCPFDPRHRMPPRYLFRHSLCCPSSPAPVDLDILSTLGYPNTLKSEKELDAQAQLFKPLQGFGSDTCISIEEDGPLDCNFFYRDAPGVVNASQQERRYFFTLPSILSIECANPECGTEGIGLSGNGEIRLLPSEFWALRRELAAWNEFPARYSYVLLETAMGLGRVKESQIIKWIISNSPSYEIIIDLPMTRHIFLLLKLCLRSILREASGMYFGEQDSVKDRFESNTDMGPPIKSMGMPGNLRASQFDCPVLLESAVWLASQVSILYGQLHSNGFVIDMLKHSFSCAGFALLSFSTAEPAEIVKSVQDLTQISNVIDDNNVSEQHINADAVGEGTQISGSPVKERKDNINFRKDLIGANCNLQSEDRSREKHEVGDGTIFEGKVFVSQVAAAVSALHERCLLEEKIKGQRHSGRLSKYQMLAEHETAVRKAAEERGRRPDYKPILEHDGLVWQRANYQDSKKHKTREEILAEERDYKRRRMSYRGKKVKRNPTEVLRDIIEGHMEEINLAGGIGCFVKGASETSLIATKPLPSDIVAETVQPLGSVNFSHSRRGELSSSNNKEMSSDGNLISYSARHDDGKTDLKGTNYCKSKGPQSSLQSFTDGNALNKYGHHQRHDYHHDDGKDRRDGTIFEYSHSRNDNDHHYSGSFSTNRFHELREHRRDSRSQDRKLGTGSHSHEGRHTSRSDERHEGRNRSRSHERKRDDSHGRYRTGDSHDRYESGHSYVSYVSAPSSKEQSRGSNREGWKDNKCGSTDNDMDNDSERKSSRSRSTAKHRERGRCAEF